MPPNTAVCRICLAMDVSLHTISGTPLQRVYENLTKAPLHTADKRPVAACYICYGLLYKCHKLTLTAAKAENVLTTIFEECAKITVRSISLVDRKANGLCAPLIISRPEYFDNIPPPIKVEEAEIKTETDLDDDDVEMKHEVLEGSLRSPNVSPLNDAYDSGQHSINAEINIKEEIQEGSNRETPNVSEDGDSEGEADTPLKNLSAEIDENIPGTSQQDDTKQKHTEDASKNKKRHKSREDLRTPIAKKPHKCDVCQITFRLKSHLKKHTKACSSKKSYECNVCQKQFEVLRSLKYHLRIHADKTYQCEVCQCSFKQLNNLQRHTKSMHSSDAKATYICDICEQRFSRKDYLINHLRKHTGEKPYQCQICKGEFAHHSNYRRHLRMHTNEKPYVCNICECKFSYKQHLQVHLRKHSGEKPYKCTYCPLQFSHQSHCKTHTRTHTGEKPYECDICQRRFTRHTHLLGHKKIHAKKNNVKV